MPIKKGQSGAFPSAKNHFRMTENWKPEFVVMHSRANEINYPAKREYFDKPVGY